MLVGIGRLLKKGQVDGYHPGPSVYYLYTIPEYVFIPRETRRASFEVKSNTDWTIS
jgi:hypothetical protein